MPVLPAAPWPANHRRLCQPLLPAAFTTDFALLHAQAAAAAAAAAAAGTNGAVDPRLPLQFHHPALGPMLVPAVGAPPPLPPGVNRAPVVWQKPLPAALRRYLPPEAAAAVGGSSLRLPVGAPPREAEVVAAAFQPQQYAQLYRLLHQHTQLLLQVGVDDKGTRGALSSVGQDRGPCSACALSPAAHDSPCPGTVPAPSRLLPVDTMATCSMTAPLPPQVYVMAATSAEPAHARVARETLRMAEDLAGWAQRQGAQRRAEVRAVPTGSRPWLRRTRGQCTHLACRLRVRCVHLAPSSRPAPLAQPALCPHQRRASPPSTLKL